MKDIFDEKDTSDLPKEIKLGRGKGDQFGDDILELFRISEKLGYTELNVNQVVVGLYRHFNKYKKKPKTNVQIMNKLGVLATIKKPALLERVRQGVYKLKKNL